MYICGIKKPRMKFTFKTEKPKGRYKSFESPYHKVKMGGKVVGSIDHDTWRIRFMVYKTDTITDDNPNCEWKWIGLSKRCESLEEAKEFLNANFDEINKKFKLYCMEEY